MTSRRLLATIVAAMLLLAAVADVGLGRGGDVLALQQVPVCEVEFTLDAAPIVEVSAGQSVDIPFTASVSVSGVSTAFVSISIGVPINFDASFSPADQVIDVSDPDVASTYNVVGSVTAVIPVAVSPGQFWDFTPSSATLTCEGAGSSAALQDSESAPGFRIVAQPPPATATATATATSTPTPPPTNTPAPTATLTPTPAPTATPVPTSTATATSPPTPSPSPSPTITATPSPSPTASPTTRPSPTAAVSSTPAPSPSRTATSTAEASTATQPTGSPTATTQYTPTPIAPTIAPTAPPPEESNDVLVLEISEVRMPADVRDDDDRTVLRAGMGLLGIIALTAGTIGIWSGIRQHI